MNNNEITHLKDGIYQIKYYLIGMLDVYAYFIVGNKCALLIDTGYSTTNVENYIKDITNLPILVVNTHGHFDHIGGDGAFQSVYLSKYDLGLAKLQSDYTYLSQFLRKQIGSNLIYKLMLKSKKIGIPLEASLHIKETNYLPLPENHSFDLEGRTITILETPGHTKGSICLYDSLTKFLFTGDMICQNAVLLNFDESTSVATYLGSLNSIKDFMISHQIDTFYPSHQLCPLSLEVIDDYRSLATTVLSNGESNTISMNKTYQVKSKEHKLLYRQVKEEEK